MKKIVSLILVSVLLLLSGCETVQEEPEGKYLYYINEKEDGLATLSIEDPGSDPAAAAEKMAAYISDTGLLPEGGSSILLNSIQIASCRIDSRCITVDLSGDYGSLSDTKKMLVRAGITKNFDQIEGIDFVNITIQEKPLLDSDGNEYGPLSSEDYVIPNGNELNAYSNMAMTLYYLNSSGRVVSEKRNVYFSSSVPVEQVVLEELIKGPYAAGNVAAIPSNISFNNIMIQENICYIDFTESIYTSMEGYDVAEAFETIAKSFESVCGVNKFQFSVNGDSSVEINGVSLEVIYEGGGSN